MSPLFPIGGAAVVTNDWCIIESQNSSVGRGGGAVLTTELHTSSVPV